MGEFKWSDNKRAAALLLARGHTEQETADTVGVHRVTVARWKSDDDFMLEVDKLTLLTGISLRAERLRIAARVIKEKVGEEKIRTHRDLLDWIKYAQSETDGAKFDLGALLEENGGEVAA